MQKIKGPNSKAAQPSDDIFPLTKDHCTFQARMLSSEDRPSLGSRQVPPSVVLVLLPGYLKSLAMASTPSTSSATLPEPLLSVGLSPSHLPSTPCREGVLFKSSP